MKKIYLAFFLLMTSCATGTMILNGLTLMSESDYEKVVAKYSDRIEIYNGLYNSFQASSTLVNSPVGVAQLDQQARLYQWDGERYNAERQKVQEKLNQQTEVFLSFYSPERKHDDLHKYDSIWKIFLDAGGKRYEGKATKIKLQTVEVQGLYPNHNRFSTPYSIVFPISVKLIENSPMKLTLTGPAGSATLNFSATTTP